MREYWDIVDGSLKELTGTLGFWGRQRARFSPRSLLADGRAALALRGLKPRLPGVRRGARAGSELPAGTVESDPAAAAHRDGAADAAVESSQTARKNRNEP